MAIDADYRTALEDLIKVQRQLRDDGVAAALEKSKRGGHLWIFFERPVLARDARIYIYHLAAKLNVQIQGTGLPKGIEIFPKQDESRPDEFGNAIRAPLGVHWGARESRGWRYWFYGADYNLADQLAYLNGIPKVTEEQLRRMIEGKEIPREFAQRARQVEKPKYFGPKPGEFRILDYVRVRRQVGRNWIARCPSCAGVGHDKSGDNLAISVDEPRKYCCWAGCTKEMIRAALGRPIPERRSAYASTDPGLILEGVCGMTTEPRLDRKEAGNRQPSLVVGPEKRRIERKLQDAGVLCQPEVSIQYQTIAKFFHMLEDAIGNTGFGKAMAEYSSRSLMRPAGWELLAECAQQYAPRGFDARSFLLPWLTEKRAPI
jgi:hypothetical protein